MSRAAPGDEVTISYDGDPVFAGDALRTPTEGRSGIGWEINPVQHDKSLRWLEGRDLPLFSGLPAAPSLS